MTFWRHESSPSSTCKEVSLTWKTVKQMTIKVILFQLLLELNTPEIQGIIYQDLEKPNRCWEMLLPFIFWVVFKVWLFLFLAKWHPIMSPDIQSPLQHGREDTAALVVLHQRNLSLGREEESKFFCPTEKGEINSCFVLFVMLEKCSCVPNPKQLFRADKSDPVAAWPLSLCHPQAWSRSPS